MAPLQAPVTSEMGHFGSQESSGHGQFWAQMVGKSSENFGIGVPAAGQQLRGWNWSQPQVAPTCSSYHIFTQPRPEALSSLTSE